MRVITIKQYLVDFYRRVMKNVAGMIPKKKNLLLFSAWFGKKYSDNSRFLFEYIRDNYNYDVYWYTRDLSLYKELQSRNIPVIYSHTIKAKWLQCRAIMLFSTVQTSDFDWWYLNNCFYIDLGHGFPGKPVGLLQPLINEKWVKDFHYSKKGLRYYETAASLFTVDYIGPCYDVQPDCFIFSNLLPYVLYFASP